MNRLFKIGDRSPQVADIQARLRAQGLEITDEGGFFGDSTKAATRTFQQRRSILVDGIVGPQTWSSLVEASWRLGDRTLYLKQPPMRGDDVALLQSRLNALGFDAGREDGIFGPLAYAAVKGFQKEYGISEDGMFGPHSHAALEGLRVDRPGTAARLREELRLRHSAGLHGAVIMVDPGHGANNKGSIGPNGAVECEICWSIGSLLAQRLSAAGATVRFSRTEPEDPDASERARRANDAGADLFVSIHLNEHEKSGAEGCSAYFFGSSRAGEALADSIHSELLRLGARDCRTHARSYAILRETRMPAVLVEPAFITNPDEEKRLEDRDYQAAVADAIVMGIRRFYEEGLEGSASRS